MNREDESRLNIEDNFRAEVVRKLAHLGALVFPAVYYFISRELALRIIIPVTAAFLIVDIVRHYHSPSAVFFNRTFGYILRTHERDRETRHLNAASWFLIAATLAVIFLPKYITVTSFTIMLFSDAASALIGRRYGKTMINGRSLEGSLAFVIVAVLVILATPKIEYNGGEYVICSIAAVFGALAEIIAGNRIDDNIAIPASIGATMWVMYVWAYPSMNLYQH